VFEARNSHARREFVQNPAYFGDLLEISTLFRSREIQKYEFDPETCYGLSSSLCVLWARAAWPKKSRSHSSLCNLCVLCVSVVYEFQQKLTTETQSTQRLHRELLEQVLFGGTMRMV